MKNAKISGLQVWH